MNKFTSNLFRILCGVICFLSVSCQNFLSGGSFMEQLTKDIDYANADEYTLVVDSDKTLGSFLSSGEKKCKVGYKIDLQFTVDSENYIFKTLEAVSSSDKNVSRSDCVEFTVTDSNEKTGVYKVSVKLLKAADDILIRPVCSAIPNVSEITPKLESAGCDQDSAIKILFNKAMDKESFGDFSCISISSDGNELEIGEYFDTPYFSEDKKALYIQPLCANDSSKLLLAPDGNQTTKNITVELNFTKKEKDCDGIALTGSSEHKYKINKNYGNIKKVTVLIRTVEGTGSFLSEGEKECTVGFSLGELTFNSNTSEYKFVGLEAVNKNNENISLSDSVSFEEIEFDEERGVYKYKVRVIEDTDDILIRPICYLLPSVESYSPVASEESNWANTPIQINFNIPIEDESIFNYTNIILTAFDEPADSLFEPPLLSQDKKTLTLVPDALKIKNKINEKKAALMSVKVSLTEKIGLVRDGKEIPLKQNANSTFSVFYSPNTEENPPELHDFFITQNEITLETAAGFDRTKIFTDKNISSKGGFTEEQFAQYVMQNLTRDTVYIYGCYYDADSGVKSIVIDEVLTNDPSEGNSLFNTPTITIYTSDSPNAEFKTVNGETKFCIKHVMTQDNGPVRLTLTVRDTCENSAVSQVYYAIKRRDPYGTSCVSVYNSVRYGYGWHDFDYTEESLHEALKTIKCVMTDAVTPGEREYSFPQVYLDVTLPQNAYTIKCQYTDRDGIEQTLQLEPQQDQWNYFWQGTLNVDHMADSVIKILGEDVLGNTYEQLIQCTSPITKDDCHLVLGYDTQGQYYWYELYYKQTYQKLIHYLVKTDKTSGKSEINGSPNAAIYPGYTYTAILCGQDLTGDFISDFSFSTDNYDSSYVPPAKIVIENAEIVPTEDPYYYDMVVTLQDNEQSSWRNYDYVTTNMSYTFNETNGTFVQRFSALDLKYKQNYAPMVINVIGFKDDRRIYSDNYTLPYLELDDWNVFDKTPPDFYSRSWSYNKKDAHVTYQIYSDDLSGIKGGNVTIKKENGEVINTYTTTAGQDYFFIIPAWEIMPKRGSYNIVEYSVEDNAGNIGQDNYSSVNIDIDYINALSLVGRKTNGDILLSVDNEYRDSIVWVASFIFKLNTEENCSWSTEDAAYNVIKEPTILDDYIMCPIKTQDSVDSISTFVKYNGISEDCIGRPQIKGYVYNINNKDTYIANLQQAGVPESVITYNQTNYGNYLMFEWFTIPEDKNLDEVMDILTSSSGDFKIPEDNIYVRIPITDTTKIPRAPYKQLDIVDGTKLPATLDNSFIKIICQGSANGELLNSVIVYNGSAGSGEYDWLMPNGHSDDYMLVCSDAPVYVHTLITDVPYNECKDWPLQEWLSFKHSIGDKYYDFTATPGQQRRYAIPSVDIQKGYSYIVIAHFSDGHIDYSNVYYKE